MDSFEDEFSPTDISPDLEWLIVQRLACNDTNEILQNLLSGSWLLDQRLVSLLWIEECVAYVQAKYDVDEPGEDQWLDAGEAVEV